ncbi:MAG: DNA polymerase I [Actinomycetota bacterium]|nr:DNA polymerase I [Actinomycetota bacterium]
MDKLILVDGYSLAFRAFFAIPVESMVTSSGQHTNALYGFMSMLVGLIEEQRPTHMAVALDLPGRTFRDELNPDYKAHRPETHPGLKSQLEMLERAIRSLGIAVVSKPGYEADDVLATLAERAAEQNVDTIVVTGDRDSFQLVRDPHIRVLYNRRGVSDYLMLDEAGVIDKVGAPPEFYPLLAALRGDPSDNLPGLPGIGDKTAARLAETYQSIDGLLEHLDALSPKVASTISGNLERLQLNMALTPLKRDLEIGARLEDLRLGPLDDDAAKGFFELIESKRLAGRALKAYDYIGHKGSERGERPQRSAVAIHRLDSLDAFAAGLDAGSKVALSISWSGQSGRSPVAALALAACPASGDAGVVCYGAEVDRSKEVESLGALVAALGSSRLVGFGCKEVFRRLVTVGIEPPALAADLGLGMYLLDASLGDYDLDGAKVRWAGELPRLEGGPEAPEEGGGLFDSDQLPTLIREAATCALLEAPLRQEIDDAGMAWLFDELELPLLLALARMEAAGIAVDAEHLRSLAREFSQEVVRLAESICQLAGRSFNVNSTKQLGEVLFDDLGLVPPKKTKTGYSTDAQSLEKLRGVHPIVEEVIRYREVEKLRSTYGDSLISEVAPDGRIHATFNQMVARTGRLSSDHPNLHNIPIRTEIGKRFRYAFVAPPGSKLVVADYSQVELRVIAHLSGDPGLIEAFTTGVDIHTATASRVFGVPPSKVTSQQRAKAKMVAYGLAYGMEAYGLAARLNVDVPEAEEILNSFFAAFPSVRSYMDEVVAKAKQLGYTETEFGRRRRIPELRDDNYRVRQAAERQAMNSGIQGLAADIFKIALVNLDRTLQRDQAVLVLQVHDEVLVEAKDEHAAAVREIVVKAMESAAKLRVPLPVNSYVVSSWGDAK